MFGHEAASGVWVHLGGGESGGGGVQPWRDRRSARQPGEVAEGLMIVANLSALGDCWVQLGWDAGFAFRSPAKPKCDKKVLHAFSVAPFCFIYFT